MNSHHIRCITAGWLLENLSEAVHSARKTLQNVAETFKTKARPIIRGAYELRVPIEVPLLDARQEMNAKVDELLTDWNYTDKSTTVSLILSDPTLL